MFPQVASLSRLIFTSCVSFLECHQRSPAQDRLEYPETARETECAEVSRKGNSSWMLLFFLSRSKNGVLSCSDFILNNKKMQCLKCKPVFE